MSLWRLRVFELMYFVNKVENLHAGLSKRPSRFDRKYGFNNPSMDERTKYCEYWRQTLLDKPAATTPDDLPQHIASMTDGFSFAYLKEAYVASLLTLVRQSEDGELAAAEDKSEEEDRKWGKFGSLLEQQVASLREDFDGGATQE